MNCESFLGCPHCPSPPQKTRTIATGTPSKLPQPKSQQQQQKSNKTSNKNSIINNHTNFARDPYQGPKIILKMRKPIRIDVKTSSRVNCSVLRVGMILLSPWRLRTMKGILVPQIDPLIKNFTVELARTSK